MIPLIIMKTPLFSTLRKVFRMGLAAEKHDTDALEIVQ